MVPDFSLKPYAVYLGDARDLMGKFKENKTFFDCVVTSPPYFGQRSYGDDPREMGNEATVKDYVETLASFFASIPLRPWASLWINLGDKRGKNGELLAVPSRFVEAMFRANFRLVDEVAWIKEVIMIDGSNIGHCMIEPAPGRLNGNGWEALFRFVVNPRRAWSDTRAIAIPRDKDHFFDLQTGESIEQHPYKAGMSCTTSMEGRNIANAWYVGNSREGKGHFAAYPKALVERCVAMTCPEWLVNDNGQAKPRKRIVEKVVYSEGTRKSKRIFGQYSLSREHRADEASLTPEENACLATMREKAGRMDFARHYVPRYPSTVGWTDEDKPVVGPGTVLDPFAGNGTTGYVAIQLGRRFVGIDLYQEYVDRTALKCEEALRRLPPC